ncbi:MAG: class I SAM-dependent methyltransferase [Thermoleophilaceae bacterium]
MPSRYDDELWDLVPAGAGAPPAHLVELAAGLGSVDAALDLGCGDGRLAEALDARALTLADVSGGALERAAMRLPEARVVELEPDAPLPLADNAFDVVLCTETIEHVRDIQLLLSEARRVLRPGGRLALTTPAHSRLTGLDVLVRGFERRFDPLSPHLRFLTRRSLAGLLCELGFDPGGVRRRAGTLIVVATR